MHTFVDDTLITFLKTIKSPLGISLRRAAERESSDKLVRFLAGEGYKPGDVIEPETAFILLCRFREQLELSLAKDASFYPSVSWIYYLRRIPNEFFVGSLLTTAPYRRMLAESIATTYGKPVGRLFTSVDFVTHRVDDTIIRRIIRFCSLCCVASDVHSDLRRAGKGMAFQLDRDGIPHANMPESAIRSMRLYDQRHEVHGNLLAGAGTFWTGRRVPDPGRLIVLAGVRKPDWIETQLGPLDVAPVEQVRVFSRFGITFANIDSLANLNSDPRLSSGGWWSRELAAVLALLRTCIILVHQLRYGLVQVNQSGYLVVADEKLDRLLSDFLPSSMELVEAVFPGVDLSASPGELLDLLANIKGSPWPLQLGPPVVKTENIMCIDLLNASTYLHRGIKYPSLCGDIANARADHFEDAVQAIVDQSAWKPSDDLMAVRGRHIKLAGQRLTNIDAIGERGDTLLIMSCKSLLYSLSYDAGEFKTVRNVASTATGALAFWTNIRATLANSPVGDNYDLSAYKSIIGIVVTPFPVYVLEGAATMEVVPGLRSVASAGELSHWLGIVTSD